MNRLFAYVRVPGRTVRLAAVVASVLLPGVLAGCGLAVGKESAPSIPTDCPQAREPYSSRTPLFDLLIDPSARAVLEREAPELLSSPFGTWPTQVPSFATILAPRGMLAQAPGGAAKLAALDTALARVEVTAAARRAQCARYDRDPPALPAQLPRPAVLVYEKITGFVHPQSPQAVRDSLRALAARRGWSIAFTNNAAVFNARDLARFDVVVWNNVSGDGLTLSQRAAFRRWIERGGGFAGLHATGGDPAYFWDWYADELLGARFTGHPMAPQFQPARLRVEPGAGAIVAGIAPEWTLKEEWYSFERSARAGGARVLVTLDESSYTPVGLGGQDLRMGDHPIAWTRCVGRGRSFFSAIGHLPETYAEPNVAALTERGIAWAAGLAGAFDPGTPSGKCGRR